jgi:hypothetical protein
MADAAPPTGEPTKSKSLLKFKRTGEILPLNDRTRKIIEARKVEEAKLTKNEQELKFQMEQKERARREK